MNKTELARIYNLYFDTVYKICFLYMKNPCDAQDMTQETFYKMLHKPFLYESDEKTKAWLIVCASNLCKNHLKKLWVKNKLSYDDSILQIESQTNNQNNLESKNDFYSLIMGLERKYLIPTYLYYYEGYKTAEIADMLHEKTSTIQTRLAKARELLRMELEQGDE